MLPKFLRHAGKEQCTVYLHSWTSCPLTGVMGWQNNGVVEEPSFFLTKMKKKPEYFKYFSSPAWFFFSPRGWLFLFPDDQMEQ